MDELKQGYKVIKNFLTKEEINLLTDYTRMKHRVNMTQFDLGQSDQGDTMFYGDPATDSLMLNKRKLMEKETGLELLPTYSFWRMYSYLADLKKHKDRPSCEISVTVFIGSDGKHEWPIYMDGKKIDLKPGDGVIYRGCDIEHWRKPYEGDYHMQVFLHYVDANGKYANHKGDSINENFTK